MIIIPGLSRPLEAVSKHIVAWDDSNERLSVEVGGVVAWAVCPRCTCGSSRTHGRYRRWLADTPSFGHPVTLAVEVRRFKCINRHCPQRTFSERLDPLAGAGQRRTLRLREAHRSLGYALGGAAAARLAARLGMRTSRHTVLRELRQAGCPEPITAPVVIGIDDWAICRGHNYGTIIVDLQRRRPIELTDGRDTSAVVPWLRTQSSIQVIARDRAGAYSDAARTAAPEAQQVADRWHLMGNLFEAIERLLLRHAKQMREAAQQVSEALQLDAASAGSPCGTDGVVLRAPKRKSWQRQSDKCRAARLARYEEAVRRHAGGASIRTIALAMKLDRRTVRNFVRAGSYPERAQRSRGPALSDAQRQYVTSRAAEGCHNATQLWRELQAQGFTGRRSVVHDALARACAAAPGDQRCRVVAASPATMGVPSTRRACAWVLGSTDPESDGQKSAPRRHFVETLCRIEPTIAEARALGQRFLGFIHRHDLAGFDRWLPRAQDCAVPELRRFAAKLKEDLPAVQAAFSSPWSNGQTEGQINRLKYLKRQMYGRAKLDLLRIRVLHPN